VSGGLSFPPEGLVLSPEVHEALRDERPVVAFESTIISHGFPYPANRQCALEAERVCRDEGATPATIALLEGKPHIGLTEEQVEHLASAGDIAKASRRDLGTLMASGADGATTVSATMILAAAAGIRVFATGGIGGVHRGAQETMDVSADLMELARTDVVVVCAGVKFVLDLPLTLEVLETHGVPVLGYGTDEFPAFYVRETGLAVDDRVDSAEEVARIVEARARLRMHGGIVLANPIPEQYEIGRAELDAWAGEALLDAEEAGVRGRDVTPFLLARLHELSGGVTEEANKQLVYSNARLAARVAMAIVEG
jgi:pseudouridine-5'-phosphate glycosidase